MPIINCPTCGHKTNTAICHQWWKGSGEASCIGKILDGKYEKGCGYDRAIRNEQQYVDNLMSLKGTEQEPGKHPLDTEVPEAQD